MRAAGIDPDKPLRSLIGSPPVENCDVGSQERGKSVGDKKVGEGGLVGVEGVEVDEAGRPTGLFQEDSMKLVESAVTAPSFETRYLPIDTFHFGFK